MTVMLVAAFAAGDLSIGLGNADYNVQTMFSHVVPNSSRTRWKHRHLRRTPRWRLFADHLRQPPPLIGIERGKHRGENVIGRPALRSRAGRCA